MTNLTGEESLEAQEIGCGLEGAENIGQEGERREVGLGDIALKSKVYTFNPQTFSTTYVWQMTRKRDFSYFVGMLPRLFGFSLKTQNKIKDLTTE